MRYHHIDKMKGILTLLMILCHSIQFFTFNRSGTLENYLVEFINLIVFSGFFFCFGFVAWGAYFTKNFTQIVPRLLRNFIKLLAAYYLSTFAYRIFIDGIYLTQEKIIEILTFQIIGPWSEFLLSFAVLNFFILILHPLIKLWTKAFIPVLLILWAASLFFTAHFDQPVFGVLAGHTDVAMFPILPYSIYFIAGIFVACNPQKVHIWALLPAGIGTGIFFLFFSQYGFPSRFPPSVFWIVGAGAFVAILYGLSLLSARFVPVTPLNRIGSHSLFYLIISNGIIFSIKSSHFFRLEIQFAITTFILVIALCYYLIGLIGKKEKKSVQHIKE